MIEYVYFKIVLAFQWAHGDGLRAQGRLLTPSELGDTVSQSRQHLIFHENPVSEPNVMSLGFWHGFDLADFETLYLRGQMELEGILGL